MNRRLLTILMIAFLVAGTCSFLVYRLVGTRVAAGHRSSTIAIVAAATDIKLGSILTAENLKTIEIAGTLPKGAILKPMDAVGRGVVTDLIQGEPILESRLAPKGAGGGFAATIRQGMRACAVKVDEVVGVAGFVLPGMRVDVLISGDPPGPPDPHQGPMVKTLLQNIQVLSAGTDMRQDNDGKPQQVRVVNLLVTPEDAEVLSLASNQTHIQLVLRNPLDTQVAQVHGSAMANLFADSPAQRIVATPKPIVRPATHPVEKRSVSTSVQAPIEVLNGSTRTQQSFAAPGVSQ